MTAQKYLTLHICPVGTILSHFIDHVINQLIEKLIVRLWDNENHH